MQTLNNKNADAYSSTNSNLLDLFCYNKKISNMDYDNFKNLITTIINAKNENLPLFIKLLKFHRLINSGNGIKNIYTLCMMVLRLEEPEIYKNVLEWSHECNKDILRLDRINNMINDKPEYKKTNILLNKPGQYKSQFKNRNNKRLIIYNKEHRKDINNNNSIKYQYFLTPEQELYSNLVFNNIKNIIIDNNDNNDNKKNIDMMLFKYLSYETGHFSIETEIIMKRVEDLINNDKDLVKIINNIK
jgi:hypothetical protein